MHEIRFSLYGVQEHGTIVRDGRKRRAIRAVRHTPHLVRVVCECVQALLLLAMVPDLHGAVAGARGKLVVVGARRNAQHPRRMARALSDRRAVLAAQSIRKDSPNAQALPNVHVIHANMHVIGGRQQAATICSERHGANRLGVSIDLEQNATLLQLDKDTKK